MENGQKFSLHLFLSPAISFAYMDDPITVAPTNPGKPTIHPLGILKVHTNRPISACELNGSPPFCGPGAYVGNSSPQVKL